MTEDDLKRLEALYAAAPPGRWRLNDIHDPPEPVYVNPKYHKAPDSIVSDEPDDDVGNIFTNDSGHYSTLEACEFVVAAHDALPKLIAEVRRLRERIADLEDQAIEQGELIERRSEAE